MEVEELPRIDAVVISHNHYDHLDVASVQAIGRRFPRAHWFVPSGLRDFVLATMEAASHVEPQRVHELLWWEERFIGDTGVKVVLTPAQHWSARNLIFDSFTYLWPRQHDYSNNAPRMDGSVNAQFDVEHFFLV